MEIPVMDEPFNLLQSFLRSEEPNFFETLNSLRGLQKHLDTLNLAKSKPIERLILALRGLDDQKTGTSDLAVLFRQIIRYYKRGLFIDQKLWGLISSRKHEFGLHVGSLLNSGEVEVLATDWESTWLEGSNEIDQISLRRFEKPAIGDGLLFAMTSWHTYQSEVQKIAVQACLNMPSGSTLLVTLPTGAGKSLCMILPAWQESQGGTIKGGTTLVITPTVSLALDQEHQIQKLGFFEEAIEDQFKPVSLTSATDPTKLQAIRDGVKYGTLPLLITSPEKLINSEFYDICLEAARKGTLNRLVIDEAHIIESWGAGFRTEFQFMATYRRRLLEVSNNKLKTILLSATVNENTERLLIKLFGETNNFAVIRANRLRPEISYWFDFCEKEDSREKHIIEAVRYLPRPLILYLTSPDDAKDWVQKLNKEGFLRVESFTGKTDSDERRRIIKEWNQDSRDIMVATSAFGMGVDKGDIRAVVHATLPENLDRFYQEVGRGGRDGCSSISLICTTPEDKQAVVNMTSTARIGAFKAAMRWDRMQTTGQFEGEAGDKVWVDPSVLPVYRQDADESQANLEWNEHTLLLLQRANLIQIQMTRDENPNSFPNNELSRRASLKVKLLNPIITNSNSFLEDAIEKTRQAEISNIRQAVQRIYNMAHNYATKRAENCLSLEFALIYPDTSLACGGCPNCRDSRRDPFSMPTDIQFEINYPLIPQANFLSGEFSTKSRPGEPINIFWEGNFDQPIYEKLKFLPKLVKLGYQQMILPDEFVQNHEWIEEFNLQVKQLGEVIPHSLYSAQSLIQNNKLILYPVPTVIMYPITLKDGSKLFTAVNKLLPTPTYMMNIVPYSLHLSCMNGSFYERVNGYRMTLETLVGQFRLNQDFYSLS